MTKCDHCRIPIRSRTCRTDTEAFGVACVHCRQRLRDRDDPDIHVVDPANIAPDDQRSGTI